MSNNNQNPNHSNKNNYYDRSNYYPMFNPPVIYNNNSIPYNLVTNQQIPPMQHYKPEQNINQKTIGHANMQKNMQQFHNNHYYQNFQRECNHQYVQHPNYPYMYPYMQPGQSNSGYQNPYIIHNYNPRTNFLKANESSTTQNSFTMTNHEIKNKPNMNNFEPRQRNQFKQRRDYKQQKTFNDYNKEYKDQKDIKNTAQSYKSRNHVRQRANISEVSEQKQISRGSYEARRKQISNGNELIQEEINNEQISSCSQSESQSEQQQFYVKKKIIRKQDPILDSRQQIRKWIEARKRNYPKNMSKGQTEQRNDKFQMSILQKKIRKKILLINSDSKSIMKKMKDIDILRRFILYPRYNRKNNHQYKNFIEKKNNDRVTQSQKHIQSIKQIQELKPQKDKNQVLDIGIKVQQVEVQSVDGEAEQIPIKNDKVEIKKDVIEQKYKKQELTVDVIIKHLQMKQQQDVKLLENLLDYKTNSFNYRYQHNTLETNMLLEDIFKQSSYILQAIRYIINNNFFDDLKK